MVWTYFNLGDDLLNAPHAGRRATLQALLKTLRWPAGSVAFWPLAIASQGRYDVNVRMFWRGLRALGSKMVCCFGDDCRAVLLRELAVSLPAGQTVLRYRTGVFFFLPDLEALAADLAPAVSSCAMVLRDYGPAPTR